jgi:DNA-directed RNA polymerase specialized sigma24 family protein
MSFAGSVSHWIEQLKAGDPTAAQRLWERYFGRLVDRARWKLAGAPRRAADEEDVALSAFANFCRAAAQGHYPQLHDRNDLWQLLVVITERKALHLVERERRARRGGGRVLDEGAFPGPGSSGQDSPLAQAPAPEPTPEFAAQVAEEFRRLLDRLGDEELRSLAVWKMEGYTIKEIAGKLGCVPRTVDRRLRLIRDIWAGDIGP